MYSSRLRILLPLPALIFLASCHREVHRPTVERIAILRFENLGTNPADDWIGRAFSEIIGDELQASHGLYTISSGRLHIIDASLGRRPVGAPGISSERIAAIAAGATRIAYGQYVVRNGNLEAWLTLEDEITGKMTPFHSVTAPVADVFTAASSMASQISPHTIPYGTRNAQVLRTHIEALENLEMPDAAGRLQAAIAADPNFGPTYRQLAQVEARQDPAAALAVLDQALTRGDALGAGERARIQLEVAAMRDDAAGRVQALAALAKSDPNDPQPWHDLAAAAMTSHQYSQAVEALRKSTALQPDDVNSWNSLGYAAAYAGDSATAVSAVGTYQKLQPGGPNALDTLGDVNLILGHLTEAENIYQQNAKTNPAFFQGLDQLKAALAHLMTGDMAGAGALAQTYFEARAAAKDPWLDYHKAQWSWISGHRQEACRQMEKLADAAAGSAREIAARAYSELAMWNLMLGNRDAAAQIAQKAGTLATPASATEATLARFLSQPSGSAAVWQDRAEHLAPGPRNAAVRDLALADALLFSKEFAAALPILQRMYDTGNPAADEGLPVLLAWADVETGHITEASALLRANPPLGDVGLTWSTPLRFPRIYYLRGVVAQKQGNADEAAKDFKLFTQLSGSTPLAWGEEQKAR